MSARGRSLLAEHWILDPDTTYLNHGTVGATPRRVLAVQQALRDEMERTPARFMLRELTLGHPAPWRRESRLREAIRPVAAFVGAQAQHIVFVQNVTLGMNAVLQSVPLRPGDEIVATSLAYGAVSITLDVVARRTGAVVHRVDPAFPPPSPGAIVDAIRAALTERTRLVVIDHVTANTALVLPVTEIAAECQARGIPVLVDGAHAPGSIDVNIAALASAGVCWYAANLHKWAHAPRTAGFLWAHPDHQEGLHHPVVSWGYGEGFPQEFENHATHDPTGSLAAPAGIALLQEWGWPTVRDDMHRLACDAGRLLTERWGTSISTPESMIGAMVTVPLPERAGSSSDEAEALRLALLEEDRIEVAVSANWGRLWIRVSCQVYNDRADITRLADAVAARVQALSARG